MLLICGIFPHQARQPRPNLVLTPVTNWLSSREQPMSVKRKKSNIILLYHIRGEIMQVLNSLLINSCCKPLSDDHVSKILGKALSLDFYAFLERK